jgi:hypothetical protein
MKKLLTALMLLSMPAVALLAKPALALDRPFEIGRARPGMLMDEFRYAAHPPGARPFCSTDPGLPPGVAGQPSLLPPSTKLAKCGLFDQDSKGAWRPFALELGGVQGQLWTTYSEINGGWRLVQAMVWMPRDGFAQAGDSLAKRWGQPAEREPVELRWKNGTSQASLLKDETATVVFVTPADPSAGGPDKAFLLGKARPGMTLDEFRMAGHPPGQQVYCSNQTDLPKAVDKKPLRVPKDLSAAKVFSCAVYAANDEGNWKTVKLTLGGHTGESLVLFAEDAAGTPRLFQAFLALPEDAFEPAVAALTDRLGRPNEANVSLARWHNARNDAYIGRDTMDGLEIFVIDNKLQPLVQSRMPAPKPPGEAKPAKEKPEKKGH